MTEEELLRRAEDLALRASRRGELTHSTFLTPAECALLSRRRPAADCVMLLHGGVPGAERRAAFFLPDWMDAEAFEPQEHLCAIELTARFGEPCHRDYLGAALGLGVGREWLGDILIEKNVAHLICLPSVKEHLLLNLDKVGRWGVKAREVPLAAVPVPEKQLREVTFSVKSPRLDAVCAGMFGLSRSAAAEAIAQGKTGLDRIFIHGIYHGPGSAADEIAVFVELHLIAVRDLLYKNNNIHFPNLRHLTPIHLAMIFF